MKRTKDSKAAESKGTNFMNLMTGALHPSPTNPRKHFAKEKINELAESIKDKGVLEPLLVREAAPGKGYEIIAGERRWRAAVIAGLNELPCIIRELSDSEVVEMQIVENMQRADLSPLEEAEGYKELHEKYGFNYDELAAKTARTKAYIYSRLRLLTLTPEVQAAIKEEKLLISWAEQMIRVVDPKQQNELLERCLDEWGGINKLKDLKRDIENDYLLIMKEAPFSIGDKKLVPAAGACKACLKRTGAQPDLFGDPGKTDTCQDAECWAEKKQAHIDKIKEALAIEGKKLLTGAQAKKAIEGYNKEFMDDRSCQLKGNITYREALEGTDYQPTYALDSTGKLREIVTAKVWDFIPDRLRQKGGGAPLTEKEKAKEKQREEQEAIKAAVKVAAVKIAFCKIAEKAEKHKNMDKKLMGLLVKAFGEAPSYYHNSGFTECALAAFGIDINEKHVDFIDAMETVIERADENKMRAILIIESIREDEIDDYTDPKGKPQGKFKKILDFFVIDFDTCYKEAMKAPVAAKGEAKAKNNKKTVTEGAGAEGAEEDEE